MTKLMALLEKILAGVLEVLEQCRRQEGGFEAVERQDGNYSHGNRGIAQVI